MALHEERYHNHLLSLAAQHRDSCLDLAVMYSADFTEDNLELTYLKTTSDKAFLMLLSE